MYHTVEFSDSVFSSELASSTLLHVSQHTLSSCLSLNSCDGSGFSVFVFATLIFVSLAGALFAAAIVVSLFGKSAADTKRHASR